MDIEELFCERVLRIAADFVHRVHAIFVDAVGSVCRKVYFDGFRMLAPSVEVVVEEANEQADGAAASTIFCYAQQEDGKTFKDSGR